MREHKFKGAITVISREPHLIIDRTKLSKALIADPSKLQWRPKEWYKAASIDTVCDDVTGVDFANKTVRTAAGSSFPYTRLILATGGQPRSLPLEGLMPGNLRNVCLLRFISDVEEIQAALGEGQRKKVVVIGSSFIGMEVGNCLSKNHDVSIIGQETAPMERIMGEEVGRIFQRNLEKAGVKFYMSAVVERATASELDQKAVGAVHLKDGTVLPADLVIVGAGVRPATDFLKNSSPSIQLEKDGSVKTDEFFAVTGLAANNKSVFAIGDIATYPYHGPGADPEKGTYTRIEHWNVAQNAGRGVARTIASSSSTGGATTIKPPKSFIPIFWSALGAQLRYCGNAVNGWDSIVLQGEPANAKFAAFYCKGETVVAVATMGKDPLMAQCAELMRSGKMWSKKQIEESKIGN